MPTTKSRATYFRERRMKEKHGDTKRVCLEEGCKTVLNRYNLNDCCWAHNTDYIIRNKIKITMLD